MFVGKQTILGWLNSALQLRLEKIEDVSGGAAAAAPPSPRAAGWVARLPVLALWCNAGGRGNPAVRSCSML
jgi:hypothetical protein